MATTPGYTHPLLAVRVHKETDFTTLAVHSENLADALLECACHTPNRF